MMNKNVVYGGIVVLILAVLAVWLLSSYSAMPNSPAPAVTSEAATSSTPDNAPTSTATANTPAKSSFRSIFTQSGNHECTFAQSGTSTQSSSVVRISNGKMRGEFRTTGTVTSADLMIYSNGSLYVWKEGSTTGKRTSITSLSELPATIPKDLTSGAIFGTSSENVSWDCHDWLAEAGQFAIPSYVSFK